MDGVVLEDWFLTTHERGNSSTSIDGGREQRAWTEGNVVTVLIDGREYFPALHHDLERTKAGDWVYLTDLQSDGDERLLGEGTEVGDVLAAAARRGAALRGLLWRSHPAGHGAAAITNLLLSRRVNDAGGEFVLDHRVRRGGSHHQKIVVIHAASRGSADEDVAFIGGIDLAHGRHDGPPHRGDDQVGNLSDPRYGERPPWHDAQLRITGPAVADVSFTFRERWEDPTPLETPTPLRALRRFVSRRPADRGDLAPRRVAGACGPHAVQVLRTYPARRPPFPFAPRGERSIARAYVKAFERAESFIYLEDQYLWSLDAARALCDALRNKPDLRCVIVIPRHPDPGGVLGAASRLGRWRIERALAAAGGDRVGIYDLENDEGTPIYVHAKVCIIDDVWMAIGSDNLNRRSWTHDSEACCAVIDSEGQLARHTRLRLAREHLADDVPDEELVEPAAWTAALRTAADALDAWHGTGREGERPRGRLRHHPRDHVSAWSRPLLHFLHARILDPDGRPRGMRSPGKY